MADLLSPERAALSHLYFKIPFRKVGDASARIYIHSRRVSLLVQNGLRNRVP